MLWLLQIPPSSAFCSSSVLNWILLMPLTDNIFSPSISRMRRQPATEPQRLSALHDKSSSKKDIQTWACLGSWTECNWTKSQTQVHITEMALRKINKRVIHLRIKRLAQSAVIIIHRYQSFWIYFSNNLVVSDTNVKTALYLDSANKHECNTMLPYCKHTRVIYFETNACKTTQCANSSQFLVSQPTFGAASNFNQTLWAFCIMVITCCFQFLFAHTFPIPCGWLCRDSKEWVLYSSVQFWVY